MVKRIIVASVLLFTVTIQADQKHCIESVLLKKDNRQIIKSYGKRCEDKGIYLKISNEKIKIKGDIFENIFFFHTSEKQILAIFTLSGAHTHIITFLERRSENKYRKVKNGELGSSVDAPFVAFDSLSIEHSIVVKTRYTKNVDMNKKVCRVLLENVYYYDNSKDKFTAINKAKELMRECL